MPCEGQLQTILYLSTSSGPGGAERVISNLSASLDPARYRAILCLFRPGWIQEHTENRGVRTYVIPTQGMFDWRWVLRVKRLRPLWEALIRHANADPVRIPWLENRKLLLALDKKIARPKPAGVNDPATRGPGVWC